MAIKGVLSRMTWADRLLVVAVGILVALSFLIFTAQGPGQRVVVEQDNKVLYTGELSQPRTLKFEGPLGDTLIQIKDGNVRVLSSPCPLKVCIRTGEIYNQGQLLACVPNRLVIRVVGGTAKEEDYDLISR